MKSGFSGNLQPWQADLSSSWSDQGYCDGALPDRAEPSSSRQRGLWSFSEQLPRAASCDAPSSHALSSCDRGVVFGLSPFDLALPWSSCVAERGVFERGFEFSMRQPRLMRSRLPVLGFSPGGGRHHS